VVYDTAYVSATVSNVTVKFLALFQMVFCRAPNADFNTLLFRLCQAYVYYFCSFIVPFFVVLISSVAQSNGKYYIKTSVRLLRNSLRCTLNLNITPCNSFC